MLGKILSFIEFDRRVLLDNIPKITLFIIRGSDVRTVMPSHNSFHDFESTHHHSNSQI